MSACWQAALGAFGGGEAASVRDAAGRCALHFAAQLGRDGACEYLLRDAGFPVNAQDEHGARFTISCSLNASRKHLNVTSAT